MREGYTVAVVGAGLVGERLVAELRRRNFPLKELRVLARSARRAELDGETFEVGVSEPEAFEGVDIAFFAGTEGEKGAAVQLADEAISRGAVVIDNCSTTQMVVTLAPLAREFGLKKVVVSTYQAVSGAGRGGVEALENGREDAFPRPIVGNAIPQIGGVGDDGYTTEETKMREETRKILSLPELPVFATAVRIPVHTGHAESVYVETEREAGLPEVLEALGAAPGVEVSEDFPTPLELAGEDGTYVGRVRVEGRVIQYWCVADNLLKGAATNAIQIAESLVGAHAR